MNDIREYIHLELYNYMNECICDLYDGAADISGQATDVVISNERNGWKELSFDLPCVMFDGEKFVDNFRTELLKSDYRIKATLEDGTVDWFVVNESKITHNGFTKTVGVTAGHGSQFLKLKNLGLVFSDEEGNNIGTAEELLKTILEGTGWEAGNCAQFYEKNSETVKVRSLNCSEKTGAFKMISTMCGLFDAKPVYYYKKAEPLIEEERESWQGYVDIIPLNPFSEELDGSLKGVETADGVLEIHYGKNLSNITRTLNSENIVTKLYVYGSYGDKTHGYCSIQECAHTEYRVQIQETLEEGKIYGLELPNILGAFEVKWFRAPYDIEADTVLMYSTLDPMTMSYLWDEDNEYAILFLGKKAGDSEIIETNERELLRWTPSVSEDVQNWNPYLFDFDYYIECGLLTDQMLQYIAQYQTKTAEDNKTLYPMNLEYTKQKMELAKTIGVVDFGQLNAFTIDSATEETPSTAEGEEPKSTDYIELVLDEDEPFIYRTDYDQKKYNQFKIQGHTKYDLNGDPIVGVEDVYPSIVYIIRDYEEPVTWNKIYVRSVEWKEDGVKNGKPDYDKTWPLKIVLNAKSGSIKIDPEKDHVYVFKLNNIGGMLGALEVVDESALKSLEEATKVVTQPHTVFFDDGKPSDAEALTFGYCWHWDTKTRKLSYISQEAGITAWSEVHMARRPSDKTPEDVNYRYDCNSAKLYKRSGAEWTDLESDKMRQQIRCFGTIYLLCMQRERLYDGVYKHNIYTVTDEEGLPKGDYFFDGAYDNYFLFSTKEPYKKGTTLDYAVGEGQSTGWVIIKEPGEEETNALAKAYRFDSVSHTENDWMDNSGKVYVIDGVEYEKAGSWYYEETAKDGGYNFTLTVPGGTVMDSGDYDIEMPEVNGGKNEPLRAGNYYFCKGEGDDKVLYLFTTTVDYSFRTVLKYNDGADTIVVTSRDGEESSITDVKTVSAKGISMTTKPPKIDDNTIYVSKIPYSRLANLEELEHEYGEKDLDTGEIVYKTELHGIFTYIKKFVDLADLVYLKLMKNIEDYKAGIKETEDLMKAALGDMYREGWWQDTSYVDGDEEKLYFDALENIVEISKPVETYSINYVDTYGAEMPLSAYGDDALCYPYMNPSIMCAAHIIDDDIGVNKWAYIDKISKCYTDKGKTRISVNTNLKTIAQKSFTDVMSTIAQVASEYKGTASKYKNTSNEEKSQGLMISSQNIMPGSITTLELADGAITDAKVGSLSADKITSGTISSNLIGANSITAQHIVAGSIDAVALNTKDIFSPQGTIYNLISEQIKTTDLDAKHITTGTLNSDIIYTGTLDAKQITAGQLDASHINATSLFATDGEFIRLFSKNIRTEYLNVDEIAAKVIETDAFKADTSDITVARITTTIGGEGLFETLESGKVYAAKLISGSAEVLNLTVGKLTVRGDDGELYDVSVVNDEETGAPSFKLDKKLVVAGSSQENKQDDTEVIPILPESIDTTELAIDKIFADDAVFEAMTAKDAFIDKLFATEIIANEITSDRFINMYVNSQKDRPLVPYVQKQSDLVKLVIEPSGSTLKTEDDTITMTVSAFCMGKEMLTSDEDIANYKWEQISGDAKKDEAFNDSHIGVKSITITGKDIENFAWYRCAYMTEKEGQQVVLYLSEPLGIYSEVVFAGLQKTVSEAALKLEDDSIIATVTQSTKYKDDLGQLQEDINNVMVNVTPDSIMTKVEQSDQWNALNSSMNQTANKIDFAVHTKESGEYEMTDAAIKDLQGKVEIGSDQISFSVEDNSDIAKAMTQVKQTADKINWVVSGEKQSEMTLTDDALSYIGEKVVINTSNISIDVGDESPLLTKIDEAKSAADDAQEDVNAISLRVTNNEGQISSVKQTADKINWVVSGNSQSEMTLTEDALSYIGNNVNISADKISLTTEKNSAIEQAIAEAETNAEQSAQAAINIAKGEIQQSVSDVDDRVTTVKQTADKIDWVVSGSSQSEMSLTDNAMALISKNVTVSANNIVLTAEGENELQGAISSVKQTADKIDWIVSSEASESNLVMTDKALSYIGKNVTVDAQNVNISAGKSLQQLTEENAEKMESLSEEIQSEKHTRLITIDSGTVVDYEIEDTLNGAIVVNEGPIIDGGYYISTRDKPLDENGAVEDVVFVSEDTTFPVYGLRTYGATTYMTVYRYEEIESSEVNKVDYFETDCSIELVVAADDQGVALLSSAEAAEDIRLSLIDAIEKVDEAKKDLAEETREREEQINELEYIKTSVTVDADGVYVGKSNSSTKAFIDNTSFNIMVNDNKVSTFSGDYIQLGKMRIETDEKGLTIKYFDPDKPTQ